MTILWRLWVLHMHTQAVCHTHIHKQAEGRAIPKARLHTEPGWSCRSAFGTRAVGYCEEHKNQVATCGDVSSLLAYFLETWNSPGWKAPHKTIWSNLVWEGEAR